MKLKAYHKIVMFYGNALHIPSSANWVAANVDGRIKAYVEEPHISHGFWEAETGAIWSIDADTKFEDENWKDTLTHCPQDQRWMIEAAAILKTAVNLLTDNKPAFAGACLQAVADRIALAAQKTRTEVSQVYREFLQHGAPMLEKDSYAELRLRSRVFSKSAS